MKQKTSRNSSEPNSKGKKQIDLDEIAKSDGFPHFVKKLEGHGDYVAYSNGELIRVYNPRTGKKVHEYRPKRVSPNFTHPVQVNPMTPISVQSTAYSRDAQIKYYGKSTFGRL